MEIPAPMFLGAHLIGDSMMLNFSLRHADWIPDFPEPPAYWGMCRRGLTARGLVAEEWYSSPWNKAAVIMVGTNDFLQISPDVSGLARPRKCMRHELKKIKDKAARRYKHIYFCTIPDIPRLEEAPDQTTRERYFNLRKKMNADIVAFGERHGSVTSVDLREKFSRDCFESFMGEGESRRQDDIHLNAIGNIILERHIIQAIHKNQLSIQ